MIHDYIEVALQLGPMPFWAGSILVLALMGAANRVRIYK